MTILKNTGFILCLSISTLLAGCDDDDGGSSEERDGSVDSGARDSSIDGSIDSALPDASTDATVTPDSGVEEAITYSVAMTPSAEIPPCTQAAPSATGNATVMLDAAGETLAVSISYSGLSGDVVMGHIHYGDATVASGPVVLPFKMDALNPSPVIQVLTAADYTPRSGTPATFAEFITELRAGKAYLNLHTAACGGGEIRGQIE